MTSQALSAESVVCRHNDQFSTELDGETVILSVEQGNYYKLDPVATAIWNLMESPISVTDMVNRLMEQFEVDRETCTRDVLAFLTELQAETLANESDE